MCRADPRDHIWGQGVRVNGVSGQCNPHPAVVLQFKQKRMARRTTIFRQLRESALHKVPYFRALDRTWRSLVSEARLTWIGTSDMLGKK